MTSEKKLSAMIGGLIVLLAAAVVLWFHGRPATPSVNALGPVDVKTFRSIQIERTASTITFENRNGAWSLTQPVEDEVEPAGMERLITALKAFTLSSVVSENPDNYQRFDVTKEKGAHVRVYAAGQEKPVLDGYVGKTAAAGSDSFFRLEGKKPVYIAAGLPSYLFTAEARQYRLAKVFPGDPLQADSVTIKVDKKTWTVTRSSDIWTVANLKTPITSYESKMLAGSLGQWFAMEFGGPADSAWTFGTTGLKAEITVMRGPVPTVIRVAKEPLSDPSSDQRGKMYPVIVDGRKFILGVPAEMIDEYFKQLKSFK